MTVAAQTVLVVEADPDLARYGAEVLGGLGYDVTVVPTADGALALIEGGAVAVTHVFADVTMPGELNGLTLARLISNLYPGIAVVLTSGDPASEDPAAEHDLRFIRKPWDAAELAALFPRLG